MNIEKLMAKKAALEQQIEQAMRAEKRKAAVADLAEQAGVLDLPDDKILAALVALAGGAPRTKSASQALPAT